MAKKKTKLVEPILEVVTEVVATDEIINEVVVEDTTELLEDVSMTALVYQEEIVEEVSEFELAMEEGVEISEFDICGECKALNEECECMPDPMPDLIVEVEEIKEVSAKDSFLNSIATVPYTIYQNGILICTSNPYLDIKAEEKYFEINFKKHSYAGIEIKYS